MRVCPQNRVNFHGYRGKTTFSNAKNGVSSIKFGRKFSTATQKRCVIGIDEAGLGPLLGPLSVVKVVVATNDPESLPKAFGDFTTPIGDSSKVHVVVDIAPIETLALAGINWLTGGKLPKNAGELFSLLGEKPEDRTLPWMNGAENLTLPVSGVNIPQWNIQGVEPIGLTGLIVHPVSLNAARRNGINKATLELDYIGKLLDPLPSGFDEIEILIDRLGGRKYYAEALQKFWPQSEINILEEVPVISSYSCTVGSQKVLIKFVVSGEANKGPLVGLASCISKYARELHMNLFNKYWCEKFPRTKPTDGYHRDGKRWMNSINKQDRTILPPLQEVLIRAGQEMDIRMRQREFF